MAYFRALLLFGSILGFYVVGTPLQRLARARRWGLAEWIPGFFHRTMCRILRVRVRFHGAVAAARPLLIVSNHVSWVDILTLSTGPAVSFLSKREVRAWPVFGTFAVLQGTVFVDRERPADLPRVNAEIASRMRAGDRIVLFAESTTSDGTSLLRFRTAHFGAPQMLLAEAPEIAEVAIQPAAVSYTSHDGHTEVPWYGDMTMLPHLWRLLKGGPYDCDIAFGEPVPFGRETDRKAAARATEAAVRGLLTAAAGRRPDAVGTASGPAGILLGDERP